MNDDPTKKLQGNADQENDSGGAQNSLNTLVGMTQSLLQRFGSLEQSVDDVKARLNRIEQSVDDVKARLTSLEARLDALEKSVNERLYDTKPIWERALAEIIETRGEMRDTLHKFGGKIDLLIKDVFTVRSEHEGLERRIDNLESNAS